MTPEQERDLNILIQKITELKFNYFSESGTLYDKFQNAIGKLQEEYNKKYPFGQY